MKMGFIFQVPIGVYCWNMTIHSLNVIGVLVEYDYMNMIELTCR